MSRVFHWEGQRGWTLPSSPQHTLRTILFSHVLLSSWFIRGRTVKFTNFPPCKCIVCLTVSGGRLCTKICSSLTRIIYLPETTLWKNQKCHKHSALEQLLWSSYPTCVGISFSPNFPRPLLLPFFPLVPYHRFWAPRRVGLSPSVLSMLHPRHLAPSWERPLSPSLCLAGLLICLRPVGLGKCRVTQTPTWV